MRVNVNGCFCAGAAACELKLDKICKILGSFSVFYTVYPLFAKEKPDIFQWKNVCFAGTFSQI